MRDSLRTTPDVVPVRRRRSVFSIIGMVVVAAVVAVLIYFAYIGWVNKGKPVPDVDVKQDAANLPRAIQSPAWARA